jgi:hypothetical protein
VVPVALCPGGVGQTADCRNGPTRRSGVDEARSEIVLRRLRTIPSLVLGLLLVTAIFRCFSPSLRSSTVPADRHSGPAILVSRPHGIRLRYVLKSELLADLCLDVAGPRLQLPGAGETALRQAVGG